MFETTSDFVWQKIQPRPRDAHKGTFGSVLAVAGSASYRGAAALAVEGAGADSVSLINTLMGMAVNVKTRKPVLSTVTGGLSGPCVKPVALRMVWQVAKVVKIPVVGLGGISCANDAIEFLLAGASAIQIGTANFIDPTVTIKVIDGINDYLDQNGFKSVKEIIGLI